MAELDFWQAIRRREFTALLWWEPVKNFQAPPNEIGTQCKAQRS